MTSENIISHTTISAVWIALGGEEPKRGRTRAFYRGGDNPSAVALDDAKGTWYDFRDGKGGGILDLIQNVRGCNRIEALKWLADFAGVQIDDYRLTPDQRQEYARRRARAQRKAREIKHWCAAYVVELNALKVAAVNTGDDEALERAATLCRILEIGSPEQVLREFSRHQSGNPADTANLIASGEEYEREAEQIAQEAVSLIAAKCQESQLVS